MVETGRYRCILKFIYEIIKYIHVSTLVLTLIDVCRFKRMEAVCELAKSKSCEIVYFDLL